MDLSIHIEDERSWERRNKKLETLKNANRKQKSEKSIKREAFLDPALYEAAKEGNADKFVTVLEKFSAEKDLSLSEIFEQVSPAGNSLLHVAASSRNGDIAKHIACLFPSLISRMNVIGHTALHVAASGGMLCIVKNLVRQGKDLPSSSSKGLAAFPAEMGANVEPLLRMQNEHGNIALHEAAMNRQFDVVSFLLSEDPEAISNLNKQGLSILHIAVKNEDQRLIVFLLRELHSQQSLLARLEGNSPVHAAIDKDKISVLEVMAKECPELLKLRNVMGHTALSYAAAKGELGPVRLLLMHFVESYFQVDEFGLLPIHVASLYGHVEIMKELLKQWPDPMDLLTGKTGENILHVAARGGRDNVVRYILGNPSLEKLLNQKDKYGNTPLHLAVMHYHPAVVLTLTWAKTIDLNPLNNDRLTPADVFFSYLPWSRREGLTMQQDLTAEALILADCKLTPQYPRINETNKQKQPSTDTSISEENKQRQPSLNSRINKDNQQTRPSLDPSIDEEDKQRRPSSDPKINEENEQRMNLWEKPPKIEWMKDTVGALLTIATLVATGTFTAGFTMPGGYNSSEQPNKGMPTLFNHHIFQFFVICNTTSFYFAILCILTCLYTKYADLAVASKAYTIALGLFGMAIVLMSMAFMAAMSLAVSKLTWLSYLVLFISIIFIVLLFLVWLPDAFPWYLRRNRIVRYVSYYISRLLIFVFFRLKKE